MSDAKPNGHRTFHLADMIFEPTDVPAFTRAVDARFEREGVTEQAIWDLRGLGYANLPTAGVNRVIIEQAARRGVHIDQDFLDEQMNRSGMARRD